MSSGTGKLPQSDGTYADSQQALPFKFDENEVLVVRKTFVVSSTEWYTVENGRGEIGDVLAWYLGGLRKGPGGKRHIVDRDASNDYNCLSRQIQRTLANVQGLGRTNLLRVDSWRCRVWRLVLCPNTTSGPNRSDCRQEIWTRGRRRLHGRFRPDTGKGMRAGVRGRGRGCKITHLTVSSPTRAPQIFSFSMLAEGIEENVN